MSANQNPAVAKGGGSVADVPSGAIGTELTQSQPPNQPASKSWRDVLPVHPDCELFAVLPPDELRALGEDIKANGLHQLISIIERRDERPDNQLRLLADGSRDRNEYVVIDGRSRLDAMEAVGIEIEIFDKDDGFLNDQLFRIVKYESDRPGFRTVERVDQRRNQVDFDPTAYVL